MTIFFIIFSLLLGISTGIRINKWSTNLNIEIQKKKQKNLLNEIYVSILKKFKDKTTKFRTRINNTVVFTANIEQLGKVELIYTLHNMNIEVFQESKCIYTSEEVDQSILNEINSTIKENYNHKIHDVVDVMGMLMSRKDFEKSIMRIEDLNKKTTDKDSSEVDNIIKSNLEKFNIDEILDKINSVGIENLSPEEKQFLNNYNK